MRSNHSMAHFIHGIPILTLECQLSSKSIRTEAFRHSNNRLNVPLNLKENCTHKYAFHERSTYFSS